ncbi:MAG TPA: segregation/condensation protein A, partial [Methanocorpusculum sp.]|nr:segregation/condensation protein A [Methanocorpusculum sp.]
MSVEESTEILVQMVERGEIDPWNIDIVQVTDKFLAELERRRELDLRISGRTLFYSSVLLRMKSDYLEQNYDTDDTSSVEEEEVEIEMDEDPFNDTSRMLSPIDLLEREISRRIKRKDARKRPVTLYDLISQLKLAEKSERRRIRREKSSVEDQINTDPTADDVVSIAHDEAYDKLAKQIYEIVSKRKTARSTGISIYDLVSELKWPLYQVY